MNEQEAKDLEELKAAVLHKKELFWSLCENINRATEHDLMTMGYRGLTNAVAMLKCFSNIEKDITKLHKDYIRKYPDDGIRSR